MAPGFAEGDDKQTNISTYRLNQPRGRFSENPKMDNLNINITIPNK